MWKIMDLLDERSNLLGWGFLILPVLITGYLIFFAQPRQVVFQVEDMRHSHDSVVDVNDTRAQNGIARRVSPGYDDGPIVFGPYVSLPPGDYVVSFVLRTEETEERSFSNIHLKVTSDKGQTVLAQKDVRANSLSTYQGVDLEFAVERQTYFVEFLAFYEGHTVLWLDQINCRKIVPLRVPLTLAFSVFIMGFGVLFQYRKSLTRSLKENRLAFIILLGIVAIFLTGYKTVSNPRDFPFAQLARFTTNELPTSQDYRGIFPLLPLIVLSYLAILALYYWRIRKDKKGNPAPKRHSISALWCAFICFNVLFSGFLTFVFTDFTPVEEVLAYSSWGAGTPSSTYITAFATFRPWWRVHKPETIVIKESGGIKHLVKVDRSSIATTEHKVLPSRSIGYYAILGGLTGLRSLPSPDIIYDYRFLVLFQRWLLILSTALLPVVLYRSFSFREKVFFPIYNFSYFSVLLLRPNKGKFLTPYHVPGVIMDGTEGIVDSALAIPLAILSVSVFIIIIVNLGLDSHKAYLNLLLAGLFLSFCTMVRGEFLFIFFLTVGFLFLSYFSDPLKRKRLFFVLVLLVSIPLFYGFANKILFESFVPLRMQSGQNLFEPIGQYPNPYGIQYSDQWVAEYLNDMGIEYLSFEADRTLTREYFQILFNNPGLFLRNFKNRLEFFGSYFSIWSSKRFPINVLTISGCLLTILILSWKHNRFLILGIPLLLAINYLIFFGWVNQLPRLIAPIHFLINIGGTFLMTFALIRLRRCH